MSTQEGFAPVGDINVSKLVAITGMLPTDLRRVLKLPDTVVTAEEARAKYRTLRQAGEAWEEACFQSQENERSGDAYLATAELFRKRLSKAHNFKKWCAVVGDVHPSLIRYLPMDIHHTLIEKALVFARTIEDLRAIGPTLQIDRAEGVPSFLGSTYQQAGVPRYPEGWAARLSAMIAKADTACGSSAERFTLAFQLSRLGSLGLIDELRAEEFYMQVLRGANLEDALAVFRRFHQPNDAWSVLALRRIAMLQP